MDPMGYILVRNSNLCFHLGNEGYSTWGLVFCANFKDLKERCLTKVYSNKLDVYDGPN